MRDENLTQITVAPCIDALGIAAPQPQPQPRLVVIMIVIVMVVPLLKSYQKQFVALHKGRCFISNGKRRWVPKAMFGERGRCSGMVGAARSGLGSADQGALGVLSDGRS
jgi:hypothetical protein